MSELTQEQKNEKLLHVIPFGNLRLVEAALKDGADVNAIDSKNSSALHLAAWAGNPDICKLLIEKGAKPEVRDEDEATPLICAAANGNCEACMAFIDAGADREARNKNGFTPLMVAADNGRSVTCATLIKAKADIEARSKNGGTALMYAAAEHNEVCRVLIEAGADVNVQDNFMLTPLIFAASAYNRDPDYDYVTDNDQKNSESRIGGMNLLRAGAYPPDQCWRADVYERVRANVALWVEETKAANRKLFAADKIPAATACLKKNGRVTDAVLDTCITGEFGELVAGPLLSAGTRASMTLFKNIWDKLPERWRDENSGLYIEYTKREPAVMRAVPTTSQVRGI